LGTVSERVKFGVLCVLLLLALGCVVFTAANTVKAVRNLQRQYSGVRTGDVSTIHPWMTIHAISHVYHIPEAYLYRSLDIASTDSFHHATLYEIASRKRQTVGQIIRALQHAILIYRKGHPYIATPTPTPRSIKKHLSPTPGRKKY
jgi:hypothetical protein